jgi:threonine/homoserine/homoserine lactone efflux protein
MDIIFLFKGIVLGFSIAAPIGPIGILCIRRTLTEGRAYGLVSGLGAATADAMYGMVAGFGLTVISSLLVGQRTWLNLIGGAFLCYLGVRTFLSKPVEQEASVRRGGLLGAYASTLFLTLTNPMTIMFFAAVFAGLGIANAPGVYPSSGLLVMGVFLGSALWWLVLTSGASLFLARFSAERWRWINRISGLVLVGFGALALLSLIHRFTG